MGHYDDCYDFDDRWHNNPKSELRSGYATCTHCDGKGQWLMPGDAHKSEGWVPCSICGGRGSIPATTVNKPRRITTKDLVKGLKPVSITVKEIVHKPVTVKIEVEFDRTKFGSLTQMISRIENWTNAVKDSGEIKSLEIENLPTKWV